jgi:hypothetical protein
MAIAKWTTPIARSVAGNIASTNWNTGITNTSESVVVSYATNSTDKYLYAAATIKLGSITPAAGGSISLRVMINDGTDTADQAAGDIYVAQLRSGASVKIIIIPMVRLYPFSMRFSLINNSGVTLTTSNNEFYLSPYGEEII